MSDTSEAWMFGGGWFRVIGARRPGPSRPLALALAAVALAGVTSRSGLVASSPVLEARLAATTAQTPRPVSG